MRVVFTKDRVVVVPDSDDEREGIVRLQTERSGHVFRAFPSGGAFVFNPLGSYEEIFREPINVTSRNPDPAVRLISNFAATPFELDGDRYASVEGFWQSLRVAGDADRRRIAALTGGEAKRASFDVETPAVIQYQERAIVWASPRSLGLDAPRVPGQVRPERRRTGGAAGHPATAARASDAAGQSKHSGRDHGQHLERASRRVRSHVEGLIGRVTPSVRRTAATASCGARQNDPAPGTIARARRRRRSRRCAPRTRRRPAHR